MANSAMPAGPPAINPSTDELFTAVYREYAPMVRWTIVNKLDGRNLDLADDLTQETFLRLFRYRDRIDFGPRVAGLLKVMAKQSIGHHYRLMRNTREVPTDTGHWSTANREMEPARGGYYTPAATGFRTAQFGGAR